MGYITRVDPWVVLGVFTRQRDFELSYNVSKVDALEGCVREK